MAASAERFIGVQTNLPVIPFCTLPPTQGKTWFHNCSGNNEDILQWLFSDCWKDVPPKDCTLHRNFIWEEGKGWCLSGRVCLLETKYPAWGSIGTGPPCSSSQYSYCLLLFISCLFECSVEDGWSSIASQQATRPQAPTLIISVTALSPLNFHSTTTWK